MATEALNQILFIQIRSLCQVCSFFKSPYNFTGYTPMDRGNQSSFLCIFWEERSLHLVFLIEELSGKCALLLQNIRCLQKKSEGCRKFRGEIGQKSLSRSFKHIKKVSKQQQEFFPTLFIPPPFAWTARIHREIIKFCARCGDSHGKRRMNLLSLTLLDCLT